MPNPFASRNKALRDAADMADERGVYRPVAAPAAPVARKPTEWSGRTEAEIGAGYKRLAPAAAPAPSDAEKEAERKRKASTGKVITNADL